MKNYEKYKEWVLEELMEPNTTKYCSRKRELVLGLKKEKWSQEEWCHNFTCEECAKKFTKWLKEECVEPPAVDWSTVAVDTPILVSEDGILWQHRHFAKYEDLYEERIYLGGGKCVLPVEEGRVVFAWSDGKTSWTKIQGCFRVMRPWKYAKLAEDETDGC